MSTAFGNNSFKTHNYSEEARTKEHLILLTRLQSSTDARKKPTYASEGAGGSLWTFAPPIHSPFST